MRKDKFDLYLEKDISVCERNYHTTESMRFITIFIPPYIYSKMLDIGCGEGREAYVLSQLGYDIIGITNGDINLKYAKEHFPKVDIISMDMHDLEFPSQSFNTIYLHHTLEHSLSPFIQIIEMYCILTDEPRGLIWVGLPEYKEPGDKDFNKEINILNHHHRNMLSPVLFKQLFNIAFNIKQEFNKDNTNTDSIYFDQSYILEKKPFNELHPNVQNLVKERQKMFG